MLVAFAILSVCAIIYDMTKEKVSETEEINISMIKNPNDSNQKVRVGIIDSDFQSDVVDFFQKDLETYNAVDSSEKFNETTIFSHGGRMLDIVNRKNFVNNNNEISNVLVSVKDRDGKIKEDYVTKAFEYFTENPVDIILISLGTDKVTSEEQEKVINKLYDEGTIVVASQANDIGSYMYPAQYKNVISVSNAPSEEYEKEETKVNVAVGYPEYSTSELSAYFVNVLANTYDNKYKENIKNLVENQEGITPKKAVKILSKN